MAQTPIRTFGNTVANQKQNIWIWAVLSAVLFSIFVIFSEREVRDLGKAMLIAALPVTFFGFTFLFRLTFDADTVSHYFLGRIQLSRKPIEELTRVEIGRGVGATLEFRDGSSIRFLGADIRLLGDMCRYIQERRPNQVEMRWNPALSALMSLDKKPRRDA
jgi:hypothetical protein